MKFKFFFTRITLFFFLFFFMLVIIPSNGIAGAVSTGKGVKYRLITKKPTALYSSPDESSSSSPCRVFQYYYVLPPVVSTPLDSTDNPEELKVKGFYRVASGDKEDEFRGYIKADDAELWTHQQVVRFTPSRGREPVYFYPSLDEAKEALEKSDTSKAVYKEPENTGQNVQLLPVMEAKEIEVKGANQMCYKTAFMAAPTAMLDSNDIDAPTMTSEETIVRGKPLTQERVRQESSVDMVFVVDTTMSMENPISQVKNSITQVAKALSRNPELKKRIRYGLVGYRDFVPKNGDSTTNALDYVSKVFCNLEEGKDHNHFIDVIGGLEVAQTGSVDYPEDVLAGVKLAMDMNKLKWNPIAWKHIIIVGDSSIKGPGHTDELSKKNIDNISIERIVSLNQPGSGSIAESLHGNYVISAVHVMDPSWVQDHDLAHKQRNILVSGPFNGLNIGVKGGQDPEDFSSQVVNWFLEQAKNFGFDILQQTDPLPGVTTTGTSASSSSGATAATKPYPVLDLLKKLAHQSSSTMFFDTSYTTELDAEGNRLLEPHLWVRKGDLMSFNALLDFIVGALQDAGEPGSKNVQNILKQLQMISTTLNIQEPISPDMPLDKFLKVIGAFPLKNDVFKVSIQDIAAMNETDYNDWVNGMRASIETVKGLTDNPHHWQRLHPQAKERQHYAFIRLRDLP